MICTYYRGFKVNKHGTRDMFASSSFAEESVERVVSSSDTFVRGHLSVWLDTVLETVQLPTGIANLYTGLTNMDRNTLTLGIKKKDLDLDYSQLHKLLHAGCLTIICPSNSVQKILLSLERYSLQKSL